MPFEFVVHPKELSIVKLKKYPGNLSGWFSLTQTPTELSLVCESEVFTQHHSTWEVTHSEHSRLAFGINQTLDMSMTGVLSSISSILS